MDDEEFAVLQQYLVEHPDAGDVIPRSGGLPQVALEGNRSRQERRHPGDLLPASGFWTDRAGDMYAKNVRENIDPSLLKRLKEGFERG